MHSSLKPRTIRFADEEGDPGKVGMAGAGDPIDEVYTKEEARLLAERQKKVWEQLRSSCPIAGLKDKMTALVEYWKKRHGDMGLFSTDTAKFQHAAVNALIEWQYVEIAADEQKIRQLKKVDEVQRLRKRISKTKERLRALQKRRGDNVAVWKDKKLPQPPFKDNELEELLPIEPVPNA